MKKQSVYKRIMLKLTGELFGNPKTGKEIFPPSYDKIARMVVDIYNRYETEIVIVVGAGNIFRGAKQDDIDQATGDNMGMLGTIINGIALQEAIEKVGVPTRLMTSIGIPAVAELFIRRKALRHLEKGRIIILGGGTGNPFFTTDSAAALRACELNCEAVLKGTSVNGIYDKDPKQFSDAKKYDDVTYNEALGKGLAVMDNTAFALCLNRNIPIVVFDIYKEGAIERILDGEKEGTLVHK